MSEPFFSVSRPRYGSPGLHLWAGPLGLHLYLKVRCCRFDWCPQWQNILS